MRNFRDVDYLKREAEVYDVPLTGNEEPDELVTRIFEGIQQKDLFFAYAIKFGSELEDWNASQWREIADYLDPKEAMRQPAFLRGYGVIVKEIVAEKFPELVGNYDPTFARALIGITGGNLTRVEAGIEALAKFHAGQNMSEVPYNGKIVSTLCQIQAVQF